MKYNKLLLTLAIIYFASIVLIAGCKKDEPVPGNTHPTVISTDAANNATDVARNKVVTATFSVPMDQATLSATTFTIKSEATPVLGTVSYTGTTATFTPSDILLYSTIYTATITTGAK